MSSAHRQNSQCLSSGRISSLLLRGVLGDNHGQAFIELALVAPIFLLLLVGAAEFGRLEYFSIEASNAARAGAAYAAQGTAFATNTSGIQTAAQNDAPNLTSVTTLNVTSNPVCQCDSSGSFTTIGKTTTACTPLSPRAPVQSVSSIMFR